MRKLITYIFFSLTMSYLICFQTLADETSLPLGDNSRLLNSQQAISQAECFLRLCNLPIPATDVYVKCDKSPSGLFIWEVRWNSDYEVDIDDETGRPIFFENNRRIWEQINGTNREGQCFTDQKSPSAELWRLAKLLGLPAAGYMARLDIVRENDASIRDANKAGSVSANFSVKPNGYPFLRYGNGMSIVLDSIDGQLVFFSQNWQMLVSSAKLTLSEKQAHSIAATNQYFWHMERGETADLTLSNQNQSELGYVQPNQMFSDIESTSDNPHVLKLAWLIHGSTENVFVDANEGNVIGGEQSKQTPPQKRSQRPQAEYEHPIPIHQAIASATEIRIYGQHMISSTMSDWNPLPFAILNHHSHSNLFSLFKATRKFGDFGIKSIPQYIFVFVIPGKVHQGYIYNGVLSKMDVMGEAAILPDALNVWLRKQPFISGMKTHK